jgi:hypothetical protein
MNDFCLHNTLSFESCATTRYLPEDGDRANGNKTASITAFGCSFAHVWIVASKVRLALNSSAIIVSNQCRHVNKVPWALGNTECCKNAVQML